MALSNAVGKLIRAGLLAAAVLCSAAAASERLAPTDLERSYSPELQAVAAQHAYLLRLVQRAQRDDDPRLLLDLVDLFARSLITLGRSDQAVPMVRKALTLAGLVNDPARHAALQAQLAMLQFYAADDLQGLQMSTEALAAQRALIGTDGKHPLPERLIEQLLDHASLLLEMGKAGELAAIVREVAPLLPDSRHRAMHQISYLALLSAVHLKLGELDQASQLLDDARAQARASGRSEWESNLLLSTGDVQLQRLDYAGAQRSFAQARDSYLKAGSHLGYALATISLSDVAIRQDRASLATRYAAEAVTLFDRLDDPFMKADTRRELALALTLSRQPERAAKWLAEAREKRPDSVSQAWALRLALVDTQLALARGDAEAARLALKREAVLREQQTMRDHQQQLQAARAIYSDTARELQLKLLARENAINELEITRANAQLNAQRLAIALGFLITIGLLLGLLYLFRRTRALRADTNTDSLTGALSRAAIERRARQVFARAAAPLSLIVFDLDRFKQINDVHGHAAGDEVLRTVVQLVRESLNEDEAIGRLGGDEFLLVLRRDDADAVHAVAAEIQRRVREQRWPGVLSSSVITLSLGIATREASTESASALTHQADLNLLKAKQAGRDQAH